MKNITWVMALNFILLQWLFIRLAYDGKIYCLVGPTLPLTGWWSDYRHLGQLKFIWLQRWYFHRWYTYVLLSLLLWSAIIYLITLYL